MSLARNRLYLLALKVLREAEMGFPPSIPDLHALAEGIAKSPDALTDLSESQQLRMQMLMDRMTKADSAASNSMKKFSEVLDQIIGNVK